MGTSAGRSQHMPAGAVPSSPSWGLGGIGEMNALTPASEDALTRRALHRYRRRASRLVLIGSTALALLVGAAALTPLKLPRAGSTGVGDRAIVYVVAFVLVVVIAGLLSWRRASRIEGILHAAPWIERRYRVSVDPLGNRRPALVLLGGEASPEAVLVVSALRWRVGILQDRNGGEILVAGDPSRRVVLRLPDSDLLFFARRPLMRWWRRKMRTWALAGPA